MSSTCILDLAIGFTARAGSPKLTMDPASLPLPWYGAYHFESVCIAVAVVLASGGIAFAAYYFFWRRKGGKSEHLIQQSDDEPSSQTTPLTNSLSPITRGNGSHLSPAWWILAFCFLYNNLHFHFFFSF